jgi:hypothetical protein
MSRIANFPPKRDTLGESTIQQAHIGSKWIMKILLQHTQTLKYLRADRTWTRHDSEARTFLHSQRAIDFAFENNLTDVYVAVKFLGGDPDVVAPLPSARPFVSLANRFAQARF